MYLVDKTDDELLDLYDAVARRRCTNWLEAGRRDNELEQINTELRIRHVQW